MQVRTNCARVWTIALAAGSALLALPAQAQSQAQAQGDRADMDRTQIIGNRELPKVLYIVPWKKPTPGEMSPRPLQSVLDESLAPVDRDVFRRQSRYGEQQAQVSSPSAVPVPPAQQQSR